MRGRMPADLDPRVTEHAQLFRADDPCPGRGRMRLTQPPGDDEDRRRDVELSQERDKQLEVVDEAVVEGQSRKPGAALLAGQPAERDEPVTPLAKPPDLAP